MLLPDSTLSSSKPMTTNRNPTPVTILTGFLGAGKTTLLNQVLNGNHGLRIAVLVNDFGAVNIDSQLILGIEDDDTISLPNGCICCMMRGELLAAAHKLAARADRPDHLIVEASGVAYPVGIVTTFASPFASEHFLLDSVLAVVDAEQAMQHLLARSAARRRFGEKIERFLYTVFPSTQAELYENQIGTADLVVLNKTDLLDDDSLAAVRGWLDYISPRARRFETTFGQIPLTLALGSGRFDLSQVWDPGPDLQPDPLEPDNYDPDHARLLQTWHFRSDTPFDLNRLEQALRSLPPGVYRAKGIIFLADYPEKRGILHVVGQRVRLVVGAAWQASESPYSEFVVIGARDGVNPDELQTRFTAALADEPSTGAKPGLMAPLLEWLRQK